MQAVILVDIQNDFLPGGALAVAHGDEVVPVANRVMQARGIDTVVASRDWHPPDHGSFASQHPGKQPYEIVDLHGLSQTLWPDHCVQHTYGARLAAGLDDARVQRVFFKGSDRTVDSYSAFFDNGRRKSTGLDAWLKGRGIRRLVLLGLATDYCVRFSVLDAICLGFATTVVADGCRAVNLNPDDGQDALQEMREAGARIVSSEALV